LDLTGRPYCLFFSASRDRAEGECAAGLGSAALCSPEAGSQRATSRIDRGA